MTKPRARVEPLSASEVVSAVRGHYGAERDGLGPEWCALDEYSLAPGAGHQRADLFLVRAWPGRPKGHERHAIEVKVSRADLRSELGAADKSAAFEDVSHRFYLATPAGLVKDTDPIPNHWGLLEVHRTGGRLTCHKVREAARRNDPAPLPERAFVEAFRRAARTESRMRTPDTNDLPARVADLERRLAAAERSLGAAREAAKRDAGRLSKMLSTIGAAGGWLCVCGKPLTVSRDMYLRGSGHVDGTRCETGRYGPDIDLASLARRLGVDATEAGPDTPVGPLVAHVLHHAPVGADPFSSAGQLRAGRPITVDVLARRLASQLQRNVPTQGNGDEVHQQCTEEVLQVAQLLEELEAERRPAPVDVA